MITIYAPSVSKQYHPIEHVQVKATHNNKYLLFLQQNIISYAQSTLSVSRSYLLTYTRSSYIQQGYLPIFAYTLSSGTNWEWLIATKWATSIPSLDGFDRLLGCKFNHVGWYSEQINM